MYCKVEDFIIMKAGTTINGLIISNQMIEDAYDTFKNIPIVYNPFQTLKDYRDSSVVENYYREKCVGWITENEVVHNIADGIVTATVYLHTGLSDRKCFDNWLIDYDKESNSFKYRACELF